MHLGGAVRKVSDAKGGMVDIAILNGVSLGIAGHFKTVGEHQKVLREEGRH